MYKQHWMTTQLPIEFVQSLLVQVQQKDHLHQQKALGLEVLHDQ